MTDDGPGIPVWLQPEIFERFARGDSSRSRRGGSTGLGLAIVAAVVRAHHGTIDVQSVPGKTEFVVKLPVNSQPSHSGDKTRHLVACRGSLGGDPASCRRADGSSHKTCLRECDFASSRTESASLSCSP